MRIDKPWGYEEILVQNQHYVLKMICINEGHRISLQMHVYKKESWYILEGNGSATLGDTMFNIRPGKFIDIDKGIVHRIFAGKGNILLLEVSTPELNDVVRLEDDYGRV